MSTNPYTQRLHQELATVKTRRWQLKKAAEQLHFQVSDAIDRENTARHIASELRHYESEYARLHHLLGIPMPMQGSVKLDAPVRPTVTRQAAPARRTMPSYITRMIGHKNCG